MWTKISRRALAALTAALLLASVAGPTMGAAGDATEPPGDRSEADWITALVYYDDSLDLGGLATRVGATVYEDYGGFALAELSPEQRAALEFGGINVQPLEDLSWLYLRDYQFDTAVGEPPLPPHLIQPDTDDGWYLVQFIGPLKKDWTSMLEDMGEVVTYYNNGSLLAYLDEATRQDIASWPFVRWVGAYHPAYRLYAGLEDGQFDITFFPGRGDTGVSELEAMGLTVVFCEEDSAIAEGTVTQAQEAAKLDSVLYIDQFQAPELCNNISRMVIRSNVPHGQGIIGRPTNQIIAITDTGIWWPHEAFSEPGKIVAIHDYPNDANQSQGDGHGHGTHVAGSALGDAPNVGVYLTYNNYDGQAYGARAINAKVFDNWGWWAAGNNYYGIWNNAYNVFPNGARVNNNSWGMSFSNGQYLASASHADRVTWGHRDYVLCMANGNEGQWGPTTVISPATAKNVISVGALERDNPENVAYFSSRGSTTDDRIKPDVMAPGHPIHSAERGNATGYIDMSGTSMATPQVSGSSALVREYFMRGFYPSGAVNANDAFTPNAALVKATLINGAVEMTGVRADWNNEWCFPNNAQGWGRVDLDRSLYFSGDTRNIIVWDDPVRLWTGQIWQGQFDVVDGSTECKVTLAWTDYPAAVNANPTLLNDFDLQVTAPDGTVFRGNNFTGFNPGYSVTGGTFDGRNTVEGVHLIPSYSFPGNLPTGTYTIRVIARNIPRPTSNFAVVAGGSVTEDPVVVVRRVAVMGDYNNLITRFLQAMGYQVTNYRYWDYTSVVNNLANHDVVVLNRVSNSTGFNSLLSAANTRQKGLIFCGSYPVSSHGMGVLSSRTSDPGSVAHDWYNGPVRTTVLSAHPVFNGYAVSQQLTIINGGDNDYQSYNGYTGSDIGSNDMTTGYSYMVGAKDRSQTGGARHVVLGSLGACYWTNPRHWTADGQQVFVNAVEWAGAGTGAYQPMARVGIMGDYQNQIGQLLTGMGYRVTQFAWNDYNGVIGALPNLDVVLLHQVSNSIGFDSLVANAAVMDRGLVFLSSYPVTGHSMGVLSSRQSDPTSVANHWYYGPVRFRVAQAHPVLSGFATGQAVTIINGGDNDFQTCSGYTGTTIGTSLMPAGLPDMIGVKDRTQTGGNRHVVLGSFGACWYTHVGHWTNSAHRILKNAIEWAKFGAP